MPAPSASPHPLSRRALLLGGALGLLPVRALARDGEDDDGHDGGHDDGDDSGRGRGRGRGGDGDGRESDREDGPGRDDDRSGPGGGEDGAGHDDRRAGDDESADRRSGDDGGPAGIPDLALLYPDGWVERIRAGRYELIDDRGRRVNERAATRGDYDRMSALIR
ncbi:hypothetical protein [Wenxinia saemankumensis]|uniref:Uncharacterized protein n=1 Tax=Wenxinia saemankumensis TaxID=1447782 RepID=A0A1M6AFW6_9RHOB|nr:hypothetical protein [Wenxinia saemankumensis]SHI35312.1 hypothetical protein SAMN05444417_0410 [Wenxinia saemankumensis]